MIQFYMMCLWILINIKNTIIFDLKVNSNIVIILKLQTWIWVR